MPMSVSTSIDSASYCGVGAADSDSFDSQPSIVNSLHPSALSTLFNTIMIVPFDTKLEREAV